MLDVSSLRGHLGLRYESSEAPFFEGTLRATADQDRVATVLGERPIEGYAMLDLKEAWTCPGELC